MFGCTIIWGVLLILPLLFLLLNCWWKNPFPHYEVRPQTYEAMTKLGNGNLQNLILIVNDNAFGQQKARIVSEFLSQQPSMIGFTFLNTVVGFDIYET